MKCYTVYTTLPRRKDAERLARGIVKKRLAACANVFPIDSVYWWKGKVERGKEHAVFFKTKGPALGRLVRELSRTHPNEVPCIVAWEIKKGEKSYLGWIGREVR